MEKSRHQCHWGQCSAACMTNPYVIPVKSAPFDGKSGSHLTQYPGTTWVHVTNGIWIGSVISSGLTVVTERLINRLMDKPCYSVSSNRPHLASAVMRLIITTRHRASTSTYSLTFCVRFLLPERHQRKPAVQAAVVMLRTPPSTANHRRASHALQWCPGLPR